MYEEYENFIKNNNLCDLQQSIAWSKIKDKWKCERIIIRNENNKISATVQILIRKIPFFGNLMYVPRGPIGNIGNEDIFKSIKNKIDDLGRKYDAFGIVIEPNIKIDNINFKNMALKYGYKVNSSAKNFKEEIQARHNFILSLNKKSEEEIFNCFHSKTRYNIRLAIKKGVKVEEKNIEGIDEFYELMEETGKRDKFIIRPKEYFKKILNEFGDCAKIYIAYYENKPISAIMPVFYGNKAQYLYGASSNEHRNLMSTYLLQWTVIKKAFKIGVQEYNLRGVCVDKGTTNGLYHFKKGFGGELIELIGQVYIPFKPIKYYLFWKVKRIFCSIRRIVKKR